jgi:acyl dehydratase
MDIQVGQKAQRTMTVTQETVAAYAAITGDYNPLHFDMEFTSKTRFERLMAQGGITTGLLHALVAMDMPGPGTVFASQYWTFPKPVYIGDTIQAEATVTSIHRRLPMADLEFRVVNQDGDEVLTGEATIYQATPLT